MSDRYTKTVLTVIAVCLVWLCIRDWDIGRPVYAQVDRGREVVKVQIVGIDESPSLGWEPLPVTVSR